MTDIANLWTTLTGDAFAGAVSLIDRGGSVVAILLLLSVAAAAVALAKAVQFFTLRVGRRTAIDAAITTWIDGNRAAAIGTAQTTRGALAHVIAHAMQGLDRGAPEHIVREDAERVALEELSGLRSYLRVLEAASQIAPLLGLFGTVIGMMGAFQALQTAGADADPAALAGGIWVALITTAVGLAVAIPAAFALYGFEARVERERENIESCLTGLFTRRLTAPAFATHTTATSGTSGTNSSSGIANAAE